MKKLALCLVSIGFAVSMSMFGPVVPTVRASDGPTHWAILIAGGGDRFANYASFWNEIGEMYEILTGSYSYTADHIFVLYADSESPNNGNCYDCENVNEAYPTNIIDFSATRDYLHIVTDTIAANFDRGDTLFVFTTDHGEQDGSLDLWGAGETISPATFAGPDYIGKITGYSWRAFEMLQCYSGAFVWWLSGARTLIATACRSDETAWGDLNYGNFSFHFNAALKGADPYGNAVDADANDDGKVSFVEAFNYAQSHDAWAQQDLEHPQYDDNGDLISHGGQMPAVGDGVQGTMIFLDEVHNPTADAGEDRLVAKTGTLTSVTLDGSDSWDPDGDWLFYSWTWAGGQAFGESPTISLPEGTTTITLQVSDWLLRSPEDTVNITVVPGGVITGLVVSNNEPPEPLLGANVAVRQSGQLIETLVTDSSGQYATALSPGTYIVTASYSGYYDLSTGVVVQDGVSTTLNFALNEVPSDGGGGGGCPFLYVWDGSEWFGEDYLNIHNPEGVDVTYEHVLMTVPGRLNGAYAFRLVEHPKTISHIDQVQLHAILEDGTVEEFPLISAQHSEDGNVLNLLLSSNDRRVEEKGADYNGGTSQSIDLKFGALGPNAKAVAFIFTIEGYNMYCKACY